MSLEKYKDFLDLLIKDLTKYLSVCGLNTSEAIPSGDLKKRFSENMQ